MTQSIALITGASRGLGAALAEQLCARGWHVVAVARTVGGLEELDDRVKSLGLPGAGSLTLAPMDVTNDDAMRHLCLRLNCRRSSANGWPSIKSCGWGWSCRHPMPGLINGFSSSRAPMSN